MKILPVQMVAAALAAMNGRCVQGIIRRIKP